MPYEAIALPEAYTVRIGSTRVGMLQSFREQTECKAAAVRAIGENKAGKLIPGALTYRVRLTRLMLDTDAVGDPFVFHNLHAFSLTLTGCGRNVLYTGCEFTSITRCCEVGGNVIEEAELIAVGRTESTSTAS